jgi:hypothetical protein
MALYNGGWVYTGDKGSTTVVVSALHGRALARVGELEAGDGGACGLLEWRRKGVCGELEAEVGSVLAGCMWRNHSHACAGFEAVRLRSRLPACSI